jgi:hypothetical protein
METADSGDDVEIEEASARDRHAATRGLRRPRRSARERITAQARASQGVREDASRRSSEQPRV